MAEEMRAHLELQTERNVATGMSPEEARHAARRQFGGVEQIQEQVRDQRGLVWLEQFIQDLRYGGRMLRRNPGFTSVIALTLALGIGINTLVFTFSRRRGFETARRSGARRGVRLVTLDRNRENDTFAYEEFERIRDGASSFSAVIVTSPHQLMLATKSRDTGGHCARLVSANYFNALGVALAFGRDFKTDDTAVGILSHEAWKRRFNADPSALGQTLLVQTSQ